MKIGVDFGTSFSSAAVCMNGKVQYITFGQERQFRTAVFFPDRRVDESLFSLTAEHEREIDNAIRARKSRYSQQLADYEKRLAAVLGEEWKRAREGDPYSPQEKEKRRSTLIKPRRFADEEMYRMEFNAILRRWREQQSESIAQEGLHVRQATGVFGEDAIDALYNNEPGTIFQSPKSMLGFKLEPRYLDVVTGVVAQVLAHIRQAAEQQLGTDVRAVVLGRPVEFRGIGASVDHLAPQRLLEQAAKDAGFTEVEFLEEPCAAALAYHVNEAVAHEALIIDIGGGTTDVAYATVGGNAAKPVIHRVWGKGLGGTDVDVELSMRVAMPLFGHGHEHGLAQYAYRSAAKVAELSRQQEFLKTCIKRVVEPFRTRLEALRLKGRTVRLNRDVEQLKIELSDDSTAGLSLDFIEPDLAAHVDDVALTASARGFLDKLGQLLEQVRSDLPEANPVIFMTGGMSRAPYVQDCVRQYFGLSRIVAGDASFGVVSGLAQFARPVETAAPAQEEQRMTRLRERYARVMAHADESAALYRTKVDDFEGQLQVQKRIFAGTDIARYLELLEQQVSTTYEANQLAGWLPQGDRFTEIEYFEALVRQDGGARRFKSVADVPGFLRHEFEDWDEEAFRAYAKDLRQEYRNVCGWVFEAQETMDEERGFEDFFEELGAWPDGVEALRRYSDQALALFDNLQEGLQRCQKAGLDLLQMADYCREDYDPTLMQELLDC
ncbi:Hsp70 family protein [Pseudomonas japonica]|uniref:Hsp70 family protein n=1 Tax=Pseudomonas japonica TaxID=256466 RepID=UPI00381D28F6